MSTMAPRPASGCSSLKHPRAAADGLAATVGMEVDLLYE